MGKVKAIGEGLKAISQYALKPERKVRAYHGSPHDFDKFDISKIGTGEGNQSFGHGLYFAENEGVAKSYRDTLTGGRPGKHIVGGKETDPRTFTDAEALAYSAIRQGKIHDMTPDDVLNMATISPKTPQSMVDEAREILKRGDYRHQEPGHMYEVDINADPDSFLDLDRPLSEQQGVFAQLAKSKSKTVKELLASEPYQTLDQSRNVYGTDIGPITGQDLIRQLSLNMEGRTTGAKSSQALGKAGIPGIKYLDAGSRSGGEGSRNYVVFDAGIVDIIKKYGIAGALGAGLISQEQAEAAQQQGMGAAPKGDRLGTPSKDETMQQRLALARQMSGSADRRATGATSPERPPEAPLTLGGSVASAASGLRSSAEGVLGMGGDLSFDTGLGFKLPLAANFMPTSEDVGKATDYLAPKPVQDWTRYESKNPVERAWKWLAEQASF